MTLSRTAGKIKVDWNYFGDVSVYYLSAVKQNVFFLQSMQTNINQI